MPEKISKHRNAIMGVAILWIVLYHSKFSFSFLPVFSSAAQFMKSNAFGGVDLFFFISGLGLFQSLSRSGDPIAFYKRRLKKILPAYLPILTIWLLINVPSISLKRLPAAVWNNLTGFAFWMQRTPQFNWYILALPVFYLVAPVFFQIIKRWNGRGEFALLGLTLGLDLCFLNSYIMIAISRFTIFALGMIVGRRCVEKRDFPIGTEIAAYAFGVLGWGLLYFFETTVPSLLWNYGLYWYPFIFITPASVCLLCRLFDVLNRTAIGKALRSVFETTGTCSLEIYLIHVKIFEALGFDSNRLWATAMAAVVIGGYVYHKLLAIVVDRNRGHAPAHDKGDAAK